MYFLFDYFYACIPQTFSYLFLSKIPTLSLPDKYIPCPVIKEFNSRSA